MMTTKNCLTGRALAALVLPVLLATGLLLGGCESDATAPQDPTPPLTESDAATQAGYVAMAVATVGPEVLNFSEPAKNIYQHTFSGDVTGTAWLDFRLGGAGGTSATWSAADWARLYTVADAPLVVPVGIGGSVELTFNITADINQGLDSAVVGGGGTFTSGVHSATFAFVDLAVTGTGSYPTGGSMTFSGGSFQMTVTFDGTNIAVIAVTGHGSWSFNLDTGDLTPLP